MSHSAEAEPAPRSPAKRKPWYRILYIQVLIAAALQKALKKPVSLVDLPPGTA